MYRWLAAGALFSVIALSACGTSEQGTEEVVAEKESAVAAKTEVSQKEEREKEEITVEEQEEEEKAKEADKAEQDTAETSKEVTEEETAEAPVEETGPASEPAEVPVEEEPVSEPETDEPAKEEPVEEEKPESKPEEKTVPEKNTEPKASEKESEEPTENLNRYSQGQFAVDGSPGQTVENDIGVFTIEKAATPGTVNAGPINIQIENVSLVSGDVTAEHVAGIAGDEVRFLKMNATLQNTSELPIMFYFAGTTINVNGHQLIAHDMFSGRTNGDYTSTTPKNVTLVYMLNESHPPSEQISNMTIDIVPIPKNAETDEVLGSGTSVNVSL
ncbi:hypothetical protein [Lentibacillus sediminis]|uniref:hypothetical protein n=1 Tax=Lentibacillus sediminis TaxID=1940529 RepID=UPI000C1C231F|nr:hypothetical protein [Lentibacillus sediminis]